MSDHPLAPLLALIQPHQYLGDVYALNYDEAFVHSHDYYRQRVGGVPRLAFLLATRLVPDTHLSATSEDAAAILLRVLDPVPLPSHDDTQRVRLDIAQRVSGDPHHHWDDATQMDATTHHILSFSGLRCRVLGTLYLHNQTLHFGTDLANYYPNQGLKVYKPIGAALGTIVNYLDPSSVAPERVPIGYVRYTSTQHPAYHHDNVPVLIAPHDLLGQKTALFGMTRSGKSNTTKTMLQAVFGLRFASNPQRIGQLVFDANGEYANDNLQDANHKSQPSSLRHVWQLYPAGDHRDVVTYGLVPHPNDPHRRLMLLNFLADENLVTGKMMLDDALALDTAKYMQHFRHVRLESPDEADRTSSHQPTRHAYFRMQTRYRRHVLVYRTLLIRAGFQPSPSLIPSTAGLFNQTLVALLAASDDPAQHTVARILADPHPSWHQLAQACTTLADLIADRSSGFADLEMHRPPSSHASGEPWADETLKKLLTMFRYPNGVRQLGRFANLHTASIKHDYANDIYRDLAAGRLVIIDHSVGDVESTTTAAERIMETLFQEQQHVFRHGSTNLPHILVYIEEAHLLLPAGSDNDLSNIWVRTAKEGAKYHLGFVYATQEVSSMQHNIIANTTNWFIGTLNHHDEIRALCKFEEFADFASSLRRTGERGFVRMKLRSHRFAIPVQIHKFEL